MGIYTQEYKELMEAKGNFSRERGYAISIGETFAGLGKEELTGRALRDKIRKEKKKAGVKNKKKYGKGR